MPIIGVSIAVPDPCGATLQAYRVALGDDAARLIPTHVTLVPPCEVTSAELPDVVEHLAGAAARTAPFSLHLRGTGSFRPTSPVVFVGVVQGISRCEQLAGQLRGGPLEVDLRFPYHPHVTVAHDLDEALLDRAFAELADFTCTFEATSFHLYEHDDVQGWRATRTFELSGAE